MSQHDTATSDARLLAQALALAKRAAPIALAVAGIAASAFGWGATYSQFSARFASVETRLVTLEREGSTPMRERVASVERDLSARRTRDSEESTRLSELLRRQGNVERLLAQLVCKQEGATSPACEKALAGIGP